MVNRRRKRRQIEPVIDEPVSMQDPTPIQNFQEEHILQNYTQIASNKESELNSAKQKIVDLEAAVKQGENVTNKLQKEIEDYKKALKLAKAENEILKKVSVYPAPIKHGGGQDDGYAAYQEMKKIQEILRSRCIQESIQAKLEIRSLKFKLERCQDQDTLNQKKLSDEIQELKAKLNELERCNQNLMVKEKMSTQKLENLMLKEQMTTQKLEEAQNIRSLLESKLNEMEENLEILSKHLEAKVEDIQDMESLNQVLIVKELTMNDELQDVRVELIKGVKEFAKDGSTIGIKRMGELNEEPFRNVCMQKFPTEDWGVRSAELSSLWQERIKDPQWFPFKVTKNLNGQFDEIIDDNDKELKELRKELGEEVYKVVCRALSEMNEYNPSTRYAVSELWNFKEDRKAQLKEAVEYLVQQKLKVKEPRRSSRLG